MARSYLVVQFYRLSLSFHVETILNQPPTEVILSGLFDRWISTLKDLRTATGSWRQELTSDLISIYNETIAMKDVDNIQSHSLYRLITHRPVQEHIILSKPKHNLL